MNRPGDAGRAPPWDASEDDHPVVTARRKEAGNRAHYTLGIEHDVPVEGSIAHEALHREFAVSCTVSGMGIPAVVILTAVGFHHDTTLNEGVHPTNPENGGLEFVTETGVGEDEAKNGLLARVASRVNRPS